MVKGRKKIPELSKEAVVEGRACMGFNLKMATRAVQNLFDSAYRAVGLEGTQYTVLAHIYVAGPITLTKLANLMWVDRTTLGRNLKPLEKRGFIEVKKGQDKRSRLIEITDKGIEVLSKALPIWQETHEKIKNILGLENWNSTLDNLNKLTVELKQN